MTKAQTISLISQSVHGKDPGVDVIQFDSRARGDNLTDSDRAILCLYKLETPDMYN